jgi:hypothetical protein
VWGEGFERRVLPASRGMEKRQSRLNEGEKMLGLWEEA